MISGRTLPGKCETTTEMLSYSHKVIQQLARRIIPDRSVGPELILYRVGKSLGAADPIYRSNGSAHGLTDWRNGRARIEILFSRSEGRRRLTWGHELGHILFDPVFSPGSLQSWATESIRDQQRRSLKYLDDQLQTIRSLRDEIGMERLCDLLSFELLLPVEDVPSVASQVTGIYTLMRAASRWRVSLSFLLLRMRECLTKEVALVQMRTAFDGRWVVTNSLGNPYSLTIGTILDQDANQEINGIADGPDSGFADITVTLNGCQIGLSAYRQGTRATALWLGEGFRRWAEATTGRQ